MAYLKIKDKHDDGNFSIFKMFDNETSHIDTRNTKLNEKYQTKVYYRTVDEQYIFEQDCQSKNDLMYETQCPSCIEINEKYKKTGRKCEHGHHFYISPVKDWCRFEIADKNYYSTCKCKFAYSDDFVDGTLCVHGNSFGKQYKREIPPEREYFSTCKHGCSNLRKSGYKYSSSVDKCCHGFPVKFVDYEKLSFNIYICPRRVPTKNIRQRDTDVENTKVKGLARYDAFWRESCKISLPSTRTKNPNETYDSFSDILGDQTKVYRIHSDVSGVRKYSADRCSGNSNKRSTYQRHEYRKYKPSRSEKNAIIQTKNLICTSDEIIIEERYKPLNDKSDGRRGKASRYVTGKKVDDFEKGKYTHKRARV